MEIRLIGIEKYFGDKKVFQKTTFSMVNGGLTTILGPSGCGKTTLLRMIAGLETPDEGEIYFNDKCVFSKEKEINLPPEKRGLGFVFQDFALWPHMSVFENVAFGLRAAKRTDRLEQKAKEALHAVQLDDFAATPFCWEYWWCLYPQSSQHLLPIFFPEHTLPVIDSSTLSL